MINKFKNLQIGSIVYSKSQMDFIEAVCKASNAIIFNEKGFELSFFEMSEAMVNEFTEKEYYPLKIEKLKKTYADLKSLSFEEEICEKIIKMEKITNMFLKKEVVSQVELEILRCELDRCIPTLSIDTILNKIYVYQKDIVKHLPNINKSILKETWLIKEYEKPVCLIKGSKELDHLNITIGNFLMIPIKDYNKSKIVFTGFLPFSKNGIGTKEIWSKQNNTWLKTFEVKTWVS